MKSAVIFKAMPENAMYDLGQLDDFLAVTAKPH